MKKNRKKEGNIRIAFGLEKNFIAANNAKTQAATSMARDLLSSKSQMKKNSCGAVQATCSGNNLISAKLTKLIGKLIRMQRRFL